MINFVLGEGVPHENVMHVILATFIESILVHLLLLNYFQDLWCSKICWCFLTWKLYTLRWVHYKHENAMHAILASFIESILVHLLLINYFQALKYVDAF